MSPYPQSTLEALFVEAVDGREYLKELVDALLIIEVSKLLKGLLDLLTQSLCLIKRRGRGRENISWGQVFCKKVDSEPRNAQDPTEKANCE